MDWHTEHQYGLRIGEVCSACGQVIEREVYGYTHWPIECEACYSAGADMHDRLAQEEDGQ